MQKRCKTIFITGGVLSSIGKGISSASLGMLLEKRGYRVTMVKMDPYLNLDPGTMSPFQHGEVFVLDDGSETDLDLGHYSRFVEQATFSRENSFSAGRVYNSVIRKEREGKYLGKTVQVIPHITDEIKESIRKASSGYDIAIVEVGGTVGDIEGLPFLEAIRQMRLEDGSENVLFIHVTLVPYIPTAAELKTKPTQHSVKELREIGIQPDVLLCRTDRVLPKDVREKLSMFCNVSPSSVFSAPDVESIYDVPMGFYEEGVDEKILSQFSLEAKPADLSKWKEMLQRLHHSPKKVKIGVVGKYTDWKESYKSLSESLIHASTQHELKLELHYLDSEVLEKEKDLSKILGSLHGILVPGGFGSRGVEGKIRAIEYARKNKVPFFGICLGMQLAVIEYARNVAQIPDATSKEFFEETGTSGSYVIDLMEEQKKVVHKGGTMRLGSYSCHIKEKSTQGATKAFQAYKKKEIQERHRHRFEVSNQYVERLEKEGLVFSGKYVDATKNLELMEMMEVEGHPWFLACQFHPEFLSKPLKPHPLFLGFIEASKKGVSS